MITRTLAASVFALALLAPAAFAGNSFGNPNAPAGSEVTNQHVEYPVNDVTVGSTQGFAVEAGVSNTGPFNTGDYIDESNVQRNQRSSN